MANLFSSTIGKKLIMSLSGLFLITFLLVHLSVNLTLLIGSDAYNTAAHFMATNPIIKVMEPILAVGFFFHIIYAAILTLRNMKSRPVQYKVKDDCKNSTWYSRNMLILGAFVLLFLVIHIINFYWKMKVTGEIDSTMVGGVEMHDSYKLVTSLFSIWWYDLLYIISFGLLGFHLTHGFWSAFQTIGLNNSIWFSRLKTAGLVYAIIVVAGFTIIPLYFLIQQ